MFTDLRSFLGRQTVIELLVAFALAAGVVSFVGSVVGGLVYTPIQERASSSDFGSVNGPLSFVLAGRVFDTTEILVSGIALLLLLLGTWLYVRLHEGALWQDSAEITTCPHCLSDIPAAARVCSYCTRDVGSVLPPS